MAPSSCWTCTTRLLDRHNRLLDRHNRLGGDLSGCLGPGSAAGVLGAGAVVVAGPHPDLVLDAFVEVGQLLGCRCRVVVGGVVGPWRIVLVGARPVDPVVSRRRAGGRVPGHVEGAGGVAGQGQGR